jgi:molecular chaperone DnaJ
VARDYYGTLGVDRTAGPDEIKRAYRKLARQLHPDVSADPESQQRFADVTAAYEVLSDPAKREVVDLGGDPLDPAGDMRGGSPFGAGFEGFEDLITTVFGGGGRTRGPRPRTRPGADALIRLDLELIETVFGSEQELAVETAVRCSLCDGAGTAAGTHPETCTTCGGRGEVQLVQRTLLGQVMTARACPNCSGFGTTIPHPCSQCGSDGRVRTRRTLTVRIPAGVEDGMRIRLAGEGEVGPGGGPPGDLYVEIHEQPHDVFTRSADDLHCRIGLPMTAAALGTILNLTTLDGEEPVEIKAGTQSGTVVRVAGKGVPRLRGGVRGDLVVHLEVRTPTKLDAEQDRLLRELAKLRGEEHPEPIRQAAGFFSRVRDAFNGHG